MIKPNPWMALFSACFMACSNPVEEVQKFEQRYERPVSVTSQVEMVYSDSGIVKAQIKGKLRETYLGPNQRVVFPQGLSVIFYGDKGEKSTLEARYGISYDLEERMEAKNDVILTNEKGERLKTEHLIWDRRAKRIYSNVATIIETKDKVIRGDGFESDESFSRYEIKKMKGEIEAKNYE